MRFRLLGHLADHRQHGPLDRLPNRAVGGVARAAEGPCERRRVELLGLPDNLCEAAKDLGEDHARVAAGAHQRRARQLARERCEVARRRRVEVLHGGANGEREVRAGVAVGDGIDVQVVDAATVALERKQRAARQLARALDIGGRPVRAHALCLTFSMCTSTLATRRPVSRSTS